MGIDSFKIEGRMKRPEYVAAAVTACRAALAGEEPDLDTLQAVFSRSGFTSAYYDNAIGREMFGFRRREDVAAAAPVLKNLAVLYHKDVQRVPVAMRLDMQEDAPSRLTVSDGTDTEVLTLVCRDSWSYDTPGQRSPITCYVTDQTQCGAVLESLWDLAAPAA